jgi:hypothetical protein
MLIATKFKVYQILYGPLQHTQHTRHCHAMLSPALLYSGLTYADGIFSLHVQAPYNLFERERELPIREIL